MSLYPTTPILTSEQFSEGISTLEKRLLHFFIPDPHCGRYVSDYTLNLSEATAQENTQPDDDEEQLDPFETANMDYLSVAQSFVSSAK